MRTQWLPTSFLVALVTACGGSSETTRLVEIPAAAPASTSSTSPTGEVENQDAPSPPTPAIPNPACKPGHFRDETILACALSPKLTVLGATAEHVVFLTAPGTSQWSLKRLDRRTLRVDEVAEDDFGRPASAFVFEPSTGNVVYAAEISVAGGYSTGLREVNVKTGASRVLLQFGVRRALFADADYAYYDGDNEAPGLHRVDLRTLQATRIAQTYGEPVNLTTTHAYFRRESNLLRIAKTGGAGEVVHGSLPSAAVTVGEDGTIYYAGERDEPWGWVLTASQNGITKTLYACVDPELCAMPKAIVIGTSEILAVAEASVTIIPKAAIPGPQMAGQVAARALYLGQAQPESVPWLLGKQLFYASARGGDDGPLEGVVAMRQLPANP